jgi:hypothetical protein
MKQTTPSQSYRDQLARMVQAITGPRRGPAHEFGADPVQRRQVALFAQELADKRLDKLRNQLEFLAGGFDDLPDLLQEFTAAVSQEAYATPLSDSDCFFQWLEENRELTVEEQDHVACQKARHEVEEAGRTNRGRHVRFQELWSVAGELADKVTTNPRLKIHLNPLRAWAQFASPALVGEDVELPADVLFFATGNQVSTALLEPAGQELVRDLEQCAPCTLRQWAHQTGHDDPAELAAFACDLADMGLVAFS